MEEVEVFDFSNLAEQNYFGNDGREQIAVYVGEVESNREDKKFIPLNDPMPSLLVEADLDSIKNLYDLMLNSVLASYGKDKIVVGCHFSTSIIASNYMDCEYIKPFTGGSPEATIDYLADLCHERVHTLRNSGRSNIKTYNRFRREDEPEMKRAVFFVEMSESDLDRNVSPRSKDQMFKMMHNVLKLGSCTGVHLVLLTEKLCDREIRGLFASKLNVQQQGYATVSELDTVCDCIVPEVSMESIEHNINSLA